MQIALKVKNKLDFSDGSCAQPDDSTSDLYSQWSFVDSMVVYWILNSMTKKLFEAYAYTTSAFALWQELQEKRKDLPSQERDCEYGAGQ